ncbi:hypothetical protein RN001_001247 [Aquatica leii]|uniref:Integrase SAM-like N-terminal domain-containing protein n=1 Tax=Aquatica leii TaxID=1421715 RepID=A0AAN7PNB4_9COLE|nr:hypothetical protein RN001_001247 [Aquatica leii]
MDSVQHNFEIPENITQQAAKVQAELLPKKSRDRYEKKYRLFYEWREQKNFKSVSDDVFLVYLSEKAKLLKPSTLWSRFSMIKSCLSIKENVDISKFPQTIAFLKRQGVGYVPKKAKVLTAE